MTDEDNIKGEVLPSETGTQGGTWPKVRRFLVFQVKLYVDALRDFILSLLSIPAFVLDLIEGKEGKGSHMENILALGRRTEKAINLFEQHTPDEQEGANVDSIIDHLEKKVRTESETLRNRNSNPGSSREPGDQL